MSRCSIILVERRDIAEGRGLLELGGGELCSPLLGALCSYALVPNEAIKAIDMKQYQKSTLQK